jgi:hypothetical protein
MSYPSIRPWQHLVNQLRLRFRTREQWWHIDWIERIDLWCAMEESFGVWETGRRYAVLSVRQVMPVLEVWERNQSANRMSGIEVENIDLVRSFLVDSAEIYVEQKRALGMDYLMSRRRDLEEIEVDESVDPSAYVIRAVLDTTVVLRTFAEDWSDEAADDGPDEVWDMVRREGFSDHLDNCDWDLRDCHYWVWLARAGRIRPEDRYEDFRKEFWSQWLDDVVHVCTEPLDVLVDEVRSTLL